MNFLDEPNLRNIATALWDGVANGMVTGRASVMIGAGFSRNAVPTSTGLSSGSTFPGWSELTYEMAKELFSSPSDKQRLDEAIQSASSTSGSLRIADEYQAWKGRGKLDALLRRAVPDDDFDPGPLHDLALRLPWADILTTNFDTLLERAAARQVDKSFSNVRTQLDIPGAQRPRIVKLHGSFPDSRPFIITEDDFRTYERNHPAMVNLVQQCFVENTCCLIGFSGEDPNFLRWTGWVRDVLGPSHMEPIYLVGLFDHSPARRALLEARHVRSIDLAPLFPRKDWPDVAVRHQASTEWFLRALLNLRPPNYDAWPSGLEEASTISNFEGSPELPMSDVEPLRSEFRDPTHLRLPEDNDLAISSIDGYEGLPEEEQISQSQRSLEAVAARSQGSALLARIDSIISVWKHNRARYPGWLVLPWHNRNALEIDTVDWIAPIVQALPNVERARGIKWLLQLQWRLDKCLLPWPTELIEAVSDFVGLKSRPLVETGLDWSQSEIEIAVQLLRAYREKGRQDDFERVSELLSGRVSGASEKACFYAHQMALASLEAWNIERAESVLGAWNVDQVDPIWRARKAVLLGEIGDAHAANEAFQALREIQAIKGRNNVAARTREAEIVWLASVLTPWLSDHRRDLDERRRFLRERGFSSASFQERLSSIVAASPPSFLERPTRLKIGEPSAVEAAYILRRYAEDTASLLRKPGLSALGAAISNAVPWMAVHSPIAALRLNVRNRDRQGNSELLNLSRLAQISPNELSPIVEGVFLNIQTQGEKLLRHSGEKQYQGTEGEHSPAEAANWLLDCSLAHLIDLIPVLVEAQLKRAIELVFDLRSGWKNGQWQTWDRIEKTVGLLLSACDDQTIFDLVPAIVEQPIVGFDTSGSSPATLHDVIAQSSLRIPARPSDGVRTSERRIAELFSALEADGDISTRARIALRMATIWRWGGLTKRQENKLRKAVSKLKSGASTNGGSLNVEYFFDAQDLLLLPKTDGGPSHLTTVIATTDWSPQIARKADGSVQSVRMSNGRDDPIYLAAGLTTEPWTNQSWMLSDADWSAKDVLNLLDNARAWIDAEASELINRHRQDELFLGRADGRALRIIEFCRKVALPKASENSDIAGAALSVLTQLEDLGLATLSAAGIRVAKGGNNEIEEAAAKMREAAASLEPAKALAFILGLLAWVSICKRKQVPAPPSDLLYEISNIVRARRAPDLNWAIDAANILLRQYPEFTDGYFRRDLALGLLYLATETDVQNPTLNVSMQQSTLEQIREASVSLAVTLQEFDEGKEIASRWLKKADTETVRDVQAQYALLDKKVRD